MIFLRTLTCHSIKIDHCPREEIAGSAEKAGNRLRNSGITREIQSLFFVRS